MGRYYFPTSTYFLNRLISTEYSIFRSPCLLKFLCAMGNNSSMTHDLVGRTPRGARLSANWFHNHQRVLEILQTAPKGSKQWTVANKTLILITELNNVDLYS